MPEILDDKKEVFTIKLTEWQHNAITQVLANANYIGKDIEGVARLMCKLRDIKKEEKPVGNS